MISEILNISKKTRVFYKFKVTKPGLFTLGSFSLNDGETVLSTEPIMFPALSYDERDLKYPVFARWNNIPEEIYVGETIPLILEMENLEELSFPERITMNPPAGGVFEKVNSVGEISVNSIGDDEVYIAPIESWLYTPTNPGPVKIPAATVSFGNIKRSTANTVVEVLPIPSQIEFSGAIGTFDVSTSIDKVQMQKGMNSTLRIKVEGDGNLNYLKMPQPEFSGLTIIEKEEVYGITPSLTGYSGYREDIYRVSIGEEEEISILFEDWNWFDRDSDSVKVESLSDYHFQNNASIVDREFISLREEFPLLTTDRILKYRNPVYNIGWYYLLVLPGIISVLASLIRKRHDLKVLGITFIAIILTSSAINDDPQYREQLDNVMTFVESGDLENALLIYDRIEDRFGENSALLYNKALINYDLEIRDMAIFNLRKALVLKPGERLFINTLTSIESDYDLDHQIIATTGISPDMLFLIFILLFNLGALFIVLNIRRRKIELSILIIMIYFLSIASLVLIYYTDLTSKKNSAIVTQVGGELKKVPGNMAGDWLTLQAGTAVNIVSETDDSFLIRTGYGLEGWLESTSLILLQD